MQYSTNFLLGKEKREGMQEVAARREETERDKWKQIQRIIRFFVESFFQTTCIDLNRFCPTAGRVSGTRYQVTSRTVNIM